MDPRRARDDDERARAQGQRSGELWTSSGTHGKALGSLQEPWERGRVGFRATHKIGLFRASRLLMQYNDRAIEARALVHLLQGVILITAAANVVKVFLTYNSSFDKAAELEGNKVCVFTIPEFWGYLDEIMFGSIDLCTLVILALFFLRAELSHEATFVLRRVLYMSAVTFMVTVVAVILNVQVKLARCAADADTAAALPLNRAAPPASTSHLPSLCGVCQRVRCQRRRLPA